jgi:acyl-CoA synthetase (AMP-forming)/AMP-acid ligase II
MEYHHATMFESVADAIPDAPALAQGSRVVSWSGMDDRSSRLSSALIDAGLGIQARVAIDLYNSNEWLESFYGIVKGRHVPVSINYRYLDDELEYLLDDSDAEALIFHASLGERVVAVAQKMPKMKVLIQVDDIGGAPLLPGVLDYEQLVTGHTPAERRDRSADDIVMWYSGGTTGLPKGILIPIGRSAEMACSQEGRLRTLGRFEDEPGSIPADIAEGARLLLEEGGRPIAMPAAPLMHSTAVSYAGPAIFACGGMVTTLVANSFDAHALFEVVERERVTTIAIVGDAFAVPMARALEERAAQGRAFDASSVHTVYSAGVVWSAEVKQRMFEHMPDVLLVDNCGSSEGAWYGTSIARKGDPTSSASFVPSPGVLLLDDDGKPMKPGSGRPGVLASLTMTKGYHKDDDKTAANFKYINGEWYTTPGDLGIFNDDGSITLVGRGSSVVNTGGEKVYPEEVDDVVKTMPDVDDCLVFGMPDEQFGQIVSAVVQLRDGATLAAEEVTAWVRERLARYKAPRRIFFVELVPRLPNGKADYPAAKGIAASASAASATDRA